MVLNGSRRGSVIVLVLVTIMLAGFMLVRFIEESSLELTLATRAADQRRLRADAYDALELTLSVIAQIRAVDDQKLQAPSQGWGDPYAYAGLAPREGVEVSIRFEDESGKLSLPTADYRRLQVLFETLGLTTYDSERAADALKAWTDKEYTAVNYEAAPDTYHRATPAHAIAGRSLRSFDEIRSIAILRDYFYDKDGQPTPLAEAFRQCVSLYSFDTTNINAAPDILLTASQLDPSQMTNLRGYLDGTMARPPGRPQYFRSMREVTQLIGGATLDNFGTEISCLRVIIDVREGLATMRLAALVTTDSNVTLPSAASSSSAETTASGTSASTTTTSRTTSSSSTRGTSGSSTRSTSSSGSNSSTSTTSTTEEKLDYPFKILEIHEDHGLEAEIP